MSNRKRNPLEVTDHHLQNSNLFNRYLPHYASIEYQIVPIFNEICENLSRLIQAQEFNPGFPLWSSKLQQFISFYGFHFTREDHVKLIRLYLSVLSIPSLNLHTGKTCLDLLAQLTRKTRLLSREDLTIDWRILYRWAKLIFFNHDESYSLVSLPKGMENSFLYCVRSCRPYFSATATQEILDEFRPCLCPFDTVCGDVMYYWDIFLPVYLPPELHHQGFKLWLLEFLDIWESVCNHPDWEQNLINLFSFVSWCNIGYIDWEPWLSRIFTRILKSLSLPVGEHQPFNASQSYSINVVATWIVAMMGNNNSCLDYLRDLFIAIKNFYHPSNTGEFQGDLINFISMLAQAVVDRVYLERTSDPVWYFNPPASHRLTDDDIIRFVECVKECTFISIFNKVYFDTAAEACHYLCQLRPELIIPPLVEQLFSSVESMAEPHRFTSILTCLAGMARQIVRQTSNFAQGQAYVLPLLISVLPGIDPNDYKKTMVTFQFLQSILKLIICVDCSSAVHTRTDLTEMEKEVCLSTSKFEDFISELLNRTFQMIEQLTTEISDALVVSIDTKAEDHQIGLELTSMISSIVEQCSEKIFHMIREKVIDFLATSSFSPKISRLLTGLVQAILKRNPHETLKSLLLPTCERIQTIINDDNSDVELTWCLTLFAELLQAHGDTLLPYKSTILSIFHRCIHLSDKRSYEAMAKAAKHVLKSLSYVYPKEHRLTVANTEEPVEDFLPIRAWGQHVDYDQLKVEFHVPNEAEVDFACEFVDTFLYMELHLLNEHCATMSNDQRLRSLTLIHSMALGCFRMIPRIESSLVDRAEINWSFTPYDSKYQAPYSLYAKEPKFRENLRMRLIIDIGHVLDHLIHCHSDDASSIKMALKIYSLSSIYYGIFETDLLKRCKDFEALKYTFKNKLCGTQQHPRFVLIERITIQLESFSMSNFRTMTEIDRQVMDKLFDLSINRYSEVRRQAQSYLFSFFSRFFFSYALIVDRMVALLTTPGDIHHHHQIKGCLYLLLGNDSIFIPTKHSWTILEKLWPALASTNHATKPSAQHLINALMEKICKRFNSVAIVEEVTEEARQVAIDLWREVDEKESMEYRRSRLERNATNLRSYHQLMEKLTLMMSKEPLTGRQEIITMTLILFLLQKQVPLSLSSIQILVDLLIHDNIDIRRIAERCVSALLRIQKPPIIHLEKSLHEILYHLNRPCPTHECCCPGDRDDNLWITLNDYQPPTTQAEWEQTCFLDKCFHGYYKWPRTIKYPMNKRERYCADQMPEQVAVIYNRFQNKSFFAQLVQYMIVDEEGMEISFDIHRFRLFKGLFRNYGIDFLDHFMDQLNLLIHEKSKEKQEGSHRLAAEMVAGMIRGSKYWTLDMLDHLWQRLIPLLREVFDNLTPDTLTHWGDCFKYGMEDLDPRRMFRLIEFLRKLISDHNCVNTFLESSRWYLVLKLTNFEWRVPAIWCAINEHAKEMLDHPYKIVREHIANILSVSLSFDIKLPNGQSTRHPNANRFIDNIRERLQQAIQICDEMPVDTDRTNDPEVLKALNFIESVIQLHTHIFRWCLQPMKSAIIRIFPYLCEVESLVGYDECVRTNLSLSRMCVAMTYLNASFLPSLIEQLEQVCTSLKWHARRVAMEFVRNMVFSNLFTARPYAQRLRDLVIRCLFDEQYEVRNVASITLSGFYQCGFVSMTDDDFNYFSHMSKTRYFTKSNGKREIVLGRMVQRHGGVLGLCAIVLSGPYDIPAHVPDALMLLCEHIHDPDLIQKSIKKTLSEFRRTHHDSWHEHREKFTDDQLVILADVLISPNYYA